MLGLPENLVSHHLRKLRAAGLLDQHPDPLDARWVHYTVSETALSAAWKALAVTFSPAQLVARDLCCHPKAPRVR